MFRGRRFESRLAWRDSRATDEDEEYEDDPLVAKQITRNTTHRGSIILAEESPDLNFTKIPYEDDLFEDDGGGGGSGGMVNDRTERSAVQDLSETYTKNNDWSSSRDCDLPTANGKIKRSVCVETGRYFEGLDQVIGRSRSSSYFSSSSRFGKRPETSSMTTSSRYHTTNNISDNNKKYVYSGKIRNLGFIYPTRKMPHSQSFAEIQAACLRSGRLYEDPDFAAVDDNVFTSRRPPRPFVWRRPLELVKDAQLVDDGASRMDVAQGRLGDCWFLAGIASLTQHKNLFQRVVPVSGQSFGKNYTGCFCFWFWQGGEWVEVVVDDRLPTINDQLIFVHSKSRSEFWSALMEKAYAKLCGSYEALKGGQTSEAMEDFTGGMTESFDLGSKAPKNLFQIMLKAVNRQSLMGCSINAKPNEIEAKLSNGLVKGHAYTVTGVRKVTARTRSGKMEVELVRVRNPWGNEREWTGAWGDKSSEWNLLSDPEKEEMELTFEDDGEFWMSYRDFISHFDRLEICMLSPGGDELENSKISWEMAMHKARWRIGSTAGGCRNNPDTFHRNPQFRITLTDVDDDDDEDVCTLIVSLMQVGRRKLRRKLGANSNLTIGFAIYKLEEEDMKSSRLDKDYFLYHASTARSNTFINARELTNRFRLKPGTYCIVPSTFDANEEGDFLLRLFSEKAKETAVQDEKTRLTRPVKPRITASEDQDLDSKYKSFFDKVAGNDAQIDAYELKKVLEAAFSRDIGDQDFNLETCRSLISMYDDNGTGKLEYDEFKQTLTTVKKCHAEFKKYDKDRSGSLSMYELQDVLDALGIKMSTRCLTAITCRYANKKGAVDFDDFVQIYTRVVGLIETFLKHQTRGGKASFDLDEFIEGAAGL